MRTRTLLLLALVCGLAILVAGVVLVAQILRTDGASPPEALGEVVRVGDMRVVVREANEAGGVLTVDVVIGGVDDADGSAGFRVITSDRQVFPISGDERDDACGATTVDERPCVLRFELVESDGTSRVLFYERGDQRARWVLGAADEATGHGATVDFDD